MSNFTYPERIEIINIAYGDQKKSDRVVSRIFKDRHKESGHQLNH